MSMLPQRRCIYCLEDKPIGEFNREHVLPQAFGKFENNFTLECVCESCNSYFSKNLELKLTRDSPEGLGRFQHGVKPAAKFKSLGARMTTRAKLMDGDFAGAQVHLQASDGQELGASPPPQIGFATSADGPFHWFQLDSIPTKEQLADLGIAERCHIRTFGIENVTEAKQVLGAAGLDCSFDGELTPPPDGRAPMEMSSKLDDINFRAVAKIAFNYAAYAWGCSVMLHAAFEDTRRYIRYGEKPEQRPVRVDDQRILSNEPQGGHYLGSILAVSIIEDRAEVLASPMNYFRYTVVLGISPNRNLPPRGHFFDPKKRKITELERECIRLHLPRKPDGYIIT